MANLETRGASVRLTWRLGGTRSGARQSCTFSGPPKARDSLATTAKALVEARNHNMTRDEVYHAVLGAEPVSETVVPTFEMWAKSWLASRVGGRDFEESSAEVYEIALRRRAIPYLGQMRLTDIDRDVIKSFVRWMSNLKVVRGNIRRRGPNARTPINAHTIEQTFGVVNTCLAAAVPQWIPVNPAARIPGERKNSVGLPKKQQFDSIFLEPWEVARILDTVEPVIKDLVFVALRTGMRRGELVTLQVRNVLFNRAGGSTILVRTTLKSKGKVGAPKSQCSVRDITVSAETTAVLQRLVSGKKPSDLVFQSPWASRWHPSTLERYWYRSLMAASRCPEHPAPVLQPRRGQPRVWHPDEASKCECAGILRRRPRLHDLRHTHASMLIAQGWHTRKIQSRLGHAKYSTTMEVYGHLLDNGDEQELGVMEDWFSPGRSAGRRSGSRSVHRRVRLAHVRRPSVHLARSA